MFAIHQYPLFAKARQDIFFKVWACVVRMLPIVTWLDVSSLETMFIITPKLGYGMAMTQPHSKCTRVQ